MPNMFGGDQNHPAYNPEAVAGPDEAHDGDLLYTRQTDGRVLATDVTGASWLVAKESLPPAVRAKLVPA